MSTHGKIGAITKSVRESLTGKHEGERASILCPGPSLEYADYSKIKDTIKICVNMAIKLHDADYCVVRDYKKISDVSMLIDRRKKCRLVVDERVMEYIIAVPVETYLFGESVFDRCAEVESIHMDNFGVSSVAYAIKLCSIMGISKVDLYGADFFYFRNKTHAFNMGSIKNHKDFRTLNGSIEDPRLTNISFDSQIMEIESGSESMDGMEILNMSKESRLSCFAKNVVV